MKAHLAEISKKRVRIQARIEGLKDRLSGLYSLRLWFGITTFFLFIFSQVFKGLYLELVGLFITLPIFIFYFRKSRTLARFIGKLEALEGFYQHQNNFQQGFLEKDTPAEQMSQPNLARDLDLGLLFASVDQTFSVQGQKLLNQWLCQDFGDLPFIQRSEIIKSLVNYPGLIRRLFIEENKVLVDFQRIEDDTNRSFFPEAIHWKWAIPCLWLGLVLSLVLSGPAIIVYSLIVIYLIALLLYLSQSSYVFKRLQDLHKDFSSLEPKFKYLEKLAHHLPVVKNLSNQETSQGIKKLNTLISFMSAHTNPFAYIVLNFIFPIDFTLIEISERYRSQLDTNLKNWGKEIALVEAAACLANLKIYHDTHWAERGDFFFRSQRSFTPTT